VLNAEPGSDVVRAALADAVISAVNYSEVLKKTIERGGLIAEAAAIIHGLSIAIIPFDEEQASASAALYPQAKPHGMSFADRACLALGVQRGFMVLTAERKMRLLTLPIKVKLIRNAH
jgi:PIN domain nuclease of toxin-antitoxin system